RLRLITLGRLGGRSSQLAGQASHLFGLGNGEGGESLAQVHRGLGAAVKRFGEDRLQLIKIGLGVTEEGRGPSRPVVFQRRELGAQRDSRRPPVPYRGFVPPGR